MASESAGRGILYQGTLSSSTVMTADFNCDQLQQASFLIRTDGTASVNYTVQATNVPAPSNTLGPPFRSDAAASPDWATLQSGTVATSTSGGSAMATVNYTPYRSLRVTLSTSGTPVTVVYAFGTGAAS